MADLTGLAATALALEKLRQQNLAQRRRSFIKQEKRVDLTKPPTSHHRGLFGDVTHFVGKETSLATRQIGTSLVHSPQGLYELGKASTLDIRDFLAEGDVTPEHLGHIGEAMVKQVSEDVRHPLRNPGYLLLDILAATSTGVGLAGKLRVASLTRDAAVEGWLDESGKLIEGAPEKYNRLRTRKTKPPPLHPSLEGPAELKGKPETEAARQLLKDMEEGNILRPQGAPKEGKGAGKIEAAEAVLKQKHVLGEKSSERGSIPNWEKDYTRHADVSEGVVIESPPLRGGIRIGLKRVARARKVTKARGGTWQLLFYDESQSRLWQKLSFKPSQADIDAYVAEGGKVENMRRYSAPDIVGTDPATAAHVLRETVKEYQQGTELRDLRVVHTQEPFEEPSGAPTGWDAQQLEMTEPVPPEERAMTFSERKAFDKARLYETATAMARDLPAAVGVRVLRTAADRSAATKELIPLINKGHVRDLNMAAKALGTTAEGARLPFSQARRVLAKAKKQGIHKRVAYTRVSEEALARLRAETPSAVADLPTALGDLYRVSRQSKEYAPGAETGSEVRTGLGPGEGTQLESELRDERIQKNIAYRTGATGAAREAAVKAAVLEREAAAQAAAKEAAAAAEQPVVRTELAAEKAAKPPSVEATFEKKPVGKIFKAVGIYQGEEMLSGIGRSMTEAKAAALKDAPSSMDQMSISWKQEKPQPHELPSEPSPDAQAPEPAVTVEDVPPPRAVPTKDETPATPEEAAAQAEIDAEWERRLREAPATSGAETAAKAAGSAQRDLRVSQEQLAEAEQKLAEARDTGTESEFRNAEADRNAVADRVAANEAKVARTTPREAVAPSEKPPPSQEKVKKELSAVADAAGKLSFAKRQGGSAEQIAKAQDVYDQAKADATIVKEAQLRQLSEEEVAGQHLSETVDAVKKEQRAKTEGRGTKGTRDRDLGIGKEALVTKYGVPLEKLGDIKTELRQSFNKGEGNQLGIFQKHLGLKEGARVFDAWKADYGHKFGPGGPSGIRFQPEYETGTGGRVLFTKTHPRTPQEATRLAIKAFLHPPRESMDISPPPVPTGKGAVDVVPDRTGIPLVRTRFAGTEEQFTQDISGLYEQPLSLHPGIKYLQRKHFETRRRIAGELPTGPGTRFAARIGLSPSAQRYLLKKRRSTKERLEIIHNANELALMAYEITDDQARAKFIQKEIDDLQKSVGDSKSFARAMDTVNQLSTMGVLYLKGPAFYIPNFVGQGLIFGMSSKFNIPRMIKAFRLVRAIQDQSDLGGELMLTSVSQGSLARLVRPEAGAKGLIGEAVRKPYGVLAEAYGSGISVKGRRITPGVDRQWRAASIGVELIERGIKTPEDAIDLLTNPARRGEWMDVVQRADDNAVSFSHMGEFEKKYVRRVVFFYPWLKGASRFSVRYLATHPVGAAVMVGASRYAADVQAAQLPQLPSYLAPVIRGPNVNVPFLGNLSKETIPGLGVVPRTFNPQSVTVLGTPGEILNTLQANIAGTPVGSEQPTQYLNPAASTFLAAVTRRDPFTGAQFPAGKGLSDIITQETGQVLYPINLYKQLRRARSGEDPSQTLLPRKVSDVLGRAATGLGPTPLNPKESQARYFAEQSGLASKQQRVYMKKTRDQTTYHETAVKLGLLKQNERLPANLRQAFNLKAQRDANQKAFEENLGHPLSTLERFEADVSLAVRKKLVSAEMGDSLLKRVASLASDSQVEKIYRVFREQYFGTSIIGVFKKYFNAQLDARGEERITVP